MDGAELSSLRAKVNSGDQGLHSALGVLTRAADRDLAAGPWAVTDKAKPGPSGDKRDYVSQAPYYWQDPAHPNGPWIHKDGQHNPIADTFTDATGFAKLATATPQLALAWYYTGDRKYADRAELLLRHWFLDPATRMNPNLTYAQQIPGIPPGNQSGVIDFNNFPGLVDAIAILDESPAWTAEDKSGMKDWLTRYLSWLTTSPQGLSEGARTNNRGSYYDAQVAAIALYLGQKDVASRVLHDVEAKRLPTQIKPDGSQPLEMARTKSWDYTVFNLRALCRLASIGRHMGLDMWTYSAPDGSGSLRKAVDALVPVASGATSWQGTQITGFNPDEVIPVLRAASRDGHDSVVDPALTRLGAGKPSAADLIPAI